MLELSSIEGFRRGVESQFSLARLRVFSFKSQYGSNDNYCHTRSIESEVAERTAQPYRRDGWAELSRSESCPNLPSPDLPFLFKQLCELL